MTVQALAANSRHFGSGGPEPYIEASERGLDFIVTGGIINRVAQFLIAGKNYKTREDLRSTTFGTASLNIRIYAEQTGAKAPIPDVAKYVSKLLTRGDQRIG